MLGVSGEAIFTGLASPAAIAIIGFFFNRHLTKRDAALEKWDKALEKQGTALEGISTSITEIKIKSAVTEQRGILFDEVRKETKELREELTIAKASLGAAWRVLDKERPSS